MPLYRAAVFGTVSTSPAPSLGRASRISCDHPLGVPSPITVPGGIAAIGRTRTSAYAADELGAGRAPRSNSPDAASAAGIDARISRAKALLRTEFLQDGRGGQRGSGRTGPN